jgi:hypothetical protein
LRELPGVLLELAPEYALADRQFVVDRRPRDAGVRRIHDDERHALYDAEQDREEEYDPPLQALVQERRPEHAVQ